MTKSGHRLIYHVFEKDHLFLKIGEKYFRKNEIWRNKIVRRKSGEIIDTELVTKNFAEVKYIPEVYKEVAGEMFLDDELKYVNSNDDGS